MISSNDLRNGVTIVIDGQLWTVIEFLHVKPGKGSAFVRTRLKNVKTGTTLERTFRAGEKLERATVDNRQMQMLYNDADGYHFMDQERFENVTLQRDLIGDPADFLKDGMVVDVQFHDGDADRRRPAGARRAEDRRNRSRLQGRYRDERDQAGEAGDRRDRQRPAVRRARRRHPHRHARPALHRPRELAARRPALCPRIVRCGLRRERLRLDGWSGRRLRARPDPPSLFGILTGRRGRHLARAHRRQ